MKTTMDYSTTAAGGRERASDLVVNRKVQVHAAETRADERWVSLATIRVHARLCYLVTLVDGLGVMADHRITAEPELNKATRTANRLVAHFGGEVQPDPEPKPRARPSAPATSRARPRHLPNGRWSVQVERDRQVYRGIFDTRKDAEAFITRVKEGN